MWREKGGRRWDGNEGWVLAEGGERGQPETDASSLHSRPPEAIPRPFILHGHLLCPGPGSIQAVPLGKCHGLGTLIPGECTRPRAPALGPCAWDRAHRVGLRVRVRGRGVGRMAAERAAEAVLEDVTRFHFPCSPASRLDSGRLNPCTHLHSTHTRLTHNSTIPHVRAPRTVPYVCYVRHPTLLHTLYTRP